MSEDLDKEISHYIEHCKRLGISLDAILVGFVDQLKKERDQAHNSAIHAAELICFQVAKEYSSDSEDGDMEMLDEPACKCMTEIRKLKRPA